MNRIFLLIAAVCLLGACGKTKLADANEFSRLTSDGDCLRVSGEDGHMVCSILFKSLDDSERVCYFYDLAYGASLKIDCRQYDHIMRMNSHK